MDTATHTPTPWQVTPDGRARVRLVHVESSIDNPAGAGLPVCSIPTARQYDAAFIVRACNAHDELVAALKRQTDAFEAAYSFTPEKDRARFAKMIVNRGLSTHSDGARAALAKAGA